MLLQEQQMSEISLRDDFHSTGLSRCFGNDHARGEPAMNNPSAQ
jgi:hypothetical protein